MTELNPKVDIRHQEVGAWAIANSDSIYQALDKRLNWRVRMGQVDAVHKSSLSELPLCKAINTLVLPPGYSKSIMGSVNFFDPNTELPLGDMQHMFGIKEDFLICITPGQFYDLQKREGNIHKPGDRVRVYKEIAPELFTLLPNDLAVLHGSIEEVWQKLKLRYMPGLLMP